MRFNNAKSIGIVVGIMMSLNFPTSAHSQFGSRGPRSLPPTNALPHTNSGSKRTSANGAFDTLIKVITTSVDPDSWDEVGGPGSIIAADSWGLLVVSQTDDVHERLALLLGALRAAKKLQDEPNAKVVVRPAQAVPIVAESEAEQTARKKIMAALNSPTQLNLEKVSLSDAVELIRNQHKLNIFIDTKALEEVGLSPDADVSINVSKISLRSAMRLMLNELGLTFSIQDEVLKVTTPEKYESAPTIRIYTVGDLAIPGRKSNRKSSGSPPATQQK